MPITVQPYHPAWGGHSDRSRGVNTILMLRGLPGMEVLEDSEQVQSNLRLGVKRTGLVEWADFARCDNACKNNLFISHVLVGDECDVQNVVHTCNESKEHVAIINLLNIW